jgi:alpha-D-ribose 1-methylphosphonate 5-triphosphate synthase subunit PhnL
MTTLTINKENAQSVIEIIMHRLEQGDMLIDLYDDETCNPIVRSWSSDDYLSVLDTMIVEDENHRA